MEKLQLNLLSLSCMQCKEIILVLYCDMKSGCLYFFTHFTPQKTLQIKLSLLIFQYSIYW